MVDLTVNPARPQGAGAAPPVMLDPAARPADDSRTGPVFQADRPSANAGSATGAVDATAELAAHARAETPIAIGIYGASGSGKSGALARLAETASAFANAASQIKGSPFVTRLLALRIDATSIAGPAKAGFAAALFDALGRSPTHSALAGDIAHAASDPRAAAQDAAERLDTGRRRLESEREALHELDGRRARLSETVLYEAAGSRVDAYARSNRARIESRLRTFGFHAGDPVANYKDLVRDVADSGGMGATAAAAFRSLWAFRGQTRLLVLAVLSFLAAWGLGYLLNTQGTWLPSMRANSGEGLAPAVTWIETNIGLLGVLRQLAIWLGLALLALNIWRAARFTMPVLRGVSLLRSDVASRSRDLDTLLAHQTRRVDVLSGEVDELAARAEDAERRVRALDTNQGRNAQMETPFAGLDPHEAHNRSAETLVAELVRGEATHPERVLVTLDELDALPPARAAQIIDAASALLARPGFVLAIAADPARLATGWHDGGTERLGKLTQIDINLDGAAGTGLVAALLSGKSQTTAARIDASASALDRPITVRELELLEKLAPLAGGTPRATKRFVNLYRLARNSSDDAGAIALALAVGAGSDAQEKTAFARAVALAPDGQQVAIPQEQRRLSEAVASVERMRDGALTGDAARRAIARAAPFSGGV